MTIEFENISEREDGSAAFTFVMSYDEMMQFAQIGMKQCLMDAARDLVESTKIADDREEELLCVNEMVVQQQKVIESLKMKMFLFSTQIDEHEKELYRTERSVYNDMARRATIPMSLEKE